MLAPRLAAAALALICAGCAGQQGLDAPASSGASMTAQAAERGQRLASATCASCHATGQAGASPLVAAPPFRDIAHRYPLDQLEARFAEGLATSHPAMPAFVFRASEIDDLIAYLETLKAEP